MTNFFKFRAIKNRFIEYCIDPQEFSTKNVKFCGMEQIIQNYYIDRLKYDKFYYDINLTFFIIQFEQLINHINYIYYTSSDTTEFISFIILHIQAISQYIYQLQIFKFLVQLNYIMNSIFNDVSQNDQGKSGTDYWKTTNKPNILFDYTYGKFYQQTAHNQERYGQFFINEKSIFIKDKEKYKSFDLIFTLLEQKLYLKNQKKVFGIKLSRNKLVTEIFTYDQQLFIKFYLLLSKICILTNFQEHYKVKSSIGCGAFSIVYDGQNISSKRIVALKAYNKSEMKKKAYGIQIVKNQILNLLTLKKYRISPLIQIFQTYDCVILVLHKAQAGDTIKYLKGQQHNFSEDLIRNIIKQILQKVKLLHFIGYIHRDLKPQNILFLNDSPNSPLYLSDLGLTVKKQDLKEKKIKHYSCGTLGFIAPQILNYVQGSEYNQLCDIFSVGCIFYFLYAGQPLFEGRNQKQRYIKNKKCQNLEAKLGAIEGIDSDALDLMRKLLKVEPKERISAFEACNHKYFANCNEKYEVIFEDTTTEIKQFLVSKIKKYWEMYKQQII